MCRDEGRGPTGAAPEAPRVEVVTLLPRSKLCLNPQLPKPNKPQLCASPEAPSGCASPGRAEGEGAGRCPGRGCEARAPWTRPGWSPAANAQDGINLLLLARNPYNLQKTKLITLLV